MARSDSTTPAPSDSSAAVSRLTPEQKKQLLLKLLNVSAPLLGGS